MAFFTKFLVSLRVLQAICSLLALSCGMYIASKLQSLTQDIDTIVVFAETAINGTVSGHDFEIVTEFGAAVENFFGGPPIRAYLLASVSFWSLCAIAYLLIARYAMTYSWLNRRSIVVSVELFTATAWVAGFVSVVLLVTEYSEVCVPFDYITRIHIFDKIIERYPVLDDILPTCELDLAATAAAATCWALWCITSLIACCTDRDGKCCGGRKRKKGDAGNIACESFTPTQTVSEISKPGFMVRASPTGYSVKDSPVISQSPATPAPRYNSPPSQYYSPVPQYSSPQSNFAIAPTDRWGR